MAIFHPFDFMIFKYALKWLKTDFIRWAISQLEAKKKFLQKSKITLYAIHNNKLQYLPFYIEKKIPNTVKMCNVLIQMKLNH